MVKKKNTNSGEIDRRELAKSWGRTLIIASAVVIFIAAVSFISLSSFTRHGERFELPSLSGMTLEEARAATEGMDIQFDILDSLYIPSMNPGVILDQYPKAGNFIKSGRRITITTNTFAPKSVKIPYITGYSLRQAKNRLVSSGLQVGKITYVKDIATNYVLSQHYNGREITPNSDIEVTVGSGIDLFVGMDDENMELRIPNVVGEQLYISKSRLWEDGINVEVFPDGNVKKGYVDRAFVYKQFPFAGETLSYGDKIELYVTLDSAKVKKSLSFIAAVSNQMVELRENIRRLTDTLSMFDNNIGIINGNMILVPDSVDEYKVDTIIVSPRYEIEFRLEDMRLKLDSLKRK